MKLKTIILLIFIVLAAVAVGFSWLIKNKLIVVTKNNPAWLIYKELGDFSDAGIANKPLFGAETPANLKLKVSEDKIINSQEFTKDGKQIVAYAYKSDQAAPALDNEIIAERTENIVIRDLGGGKFSAQSGYNFYKENGEWKQVKFATTTKEIFDKETLSPISWLIKTVWAASVVGPKSGGTFVDDSSVGTKSWSSPGAAATSDDSWAQFATDYYANQQSHYLKATGFGFSIPTGATIDGIKAEVEERSASALTAYSDASIKIVKANVISGSEMSTGASYSNSDVYHTHGGATSLWGLSWTAEDINDSTFGVAVSLNAYRVLNVGYGRIDHIRMTVYYTAAPQTIIFRASPTQGSATIFRSGGTVIFRAPQ